MPDTLPKPLTRDALEKDWWDRWWAEDFSWEGLAKKKIAGTGGLHGEKTLQDYWLYDLSKPPEAQLDRATRESEMEAAGELVRDPNGRLWHLAHVPLTWPNGDRAKSGWQYQQRDSLREILKARLMNAQRTQFGELLLPVGGTDGRAQFKGAIFMSGDFPTPDNLGVLHLDAEWAWFDSLNANERTFGPGARFDRAFFSGNTRFDQANFAETAGFQGTEFAGEARFNEAVFAALISFEDATFAGPTVFYKTTFSGDAHLGRVRFGGDAGFEHAVFRGLTSFRGASFKSDCRFHRARFQKDAHFKLARFQAHMNFGEAVFEDQAFFEDILWPGSPGNWHKIFDRTFFRSYAFFRGATRPGSEEGERFIPHAAFDGTKFERTPDIDVTSEGAARQNFEDSLQGAKFIASERKPASSQGALRPLTELERGCRVLKKAMADASDRNREQMFYRFELIARNARTDTPWEERCVSRAYAAVSDYGTSIVRPWLWLFALAGYAAGAYFFIGVFVVSEKLVPWQWLWDAFDLSLSRVFQPLTFWSAANLQDNELGMALIGEKNQGLLALSVRILGTVQSLLSVILIFLSGLALRRRFQVN